MYYPKSKVIFSHIPKTGGSSLEYFLGQIEHPVLFETKYKSVSNKMLFLNDLYKRYSLEGGDKRGNIHRPAKKYIEALGETEYDTYYSFSFVRNPFSQIKSLYTMTKVDLTKRGKPCPTWYEFIWDTNNKNSIFKLDGFFNQVRFLSNRRGDILVNEIFPFEYYEECVKYLAEKLNFTPNFDVRLWSTEPEYEFTPDMIENVMDNYGDSYELWKEVKTNWEIYKKPYEGRKKSSTGNPG